eukprot:364563-Chlamydomonas_euryale.AAC.7
MAASIAAASSHSRASSRQGFQPQQDFQLASGGEHCSNAAGRSYRPRDQGETTWSIARGGGILSPLQDLL